MPYKNADRQREAQRDWARRKAFKNAKGYVCFDCGTKENLTYGKKTRCRRCLRVYNALDQRATPEENELQNERRVAKQLLRKWAKVKNMKLPDEIAYAYAIINKAISHLHGRR